MRGTCIVILVAVVWAAMAADQVGTLSSSGTTTLRGASVPGPVQALPLASGDEIVTGALPASLLLADKSSFTVEAKSRLWPERQGAKTMICLAQGGLRFNIPAAARVEVCALGRPIGLEAPSEGVVTIEADQVHAVTTKGAALVNEKGSCGCAGMPVSVTKAWSTSKKAAVTLGVVGTAGATAAIGFAAGREEPAAVSPSRP